MTAEQLGLSILLAQTALAFTLVLPINAIFTFGEEFGWRGYLLPKLLPLGSVSAAVISGAIWGLWHAPLIVLDSYNYPGYPWWGVLMMVLFCVEVGIVQAWLRYRSGSIWPAVLSHAALNGQAGFALLMLSKGDALLAPPLGLLGLAPLAVFVIVLIVAKQLKPVGVTGNVGTKQSVGVTDSIGIKQNESPEKA
jgi:membrane protease YdiL (CAAX protease family)